MSSRLMEQKLKRISKVNNEHIMKNISQTKGPKSALGMSSLQTSGMKSARSKQGLGSGKKPAMVNTFENHIRG